MWFTKPPRIGRALLATILVTVFGFIPGMGTPGILMFLVVSPFPFITALFDSLKGDTGWSAAIVMTLVGPLLAFITYVITYGPTQRLSKYYRITCRILAIMLVWYVAALVILQSHARAQQQNPERGTMMEYLP